MAVSAKKVGLYGTVGFLVAALIIVGVVISSVKIPSLRPPTFIPDTGTLIIKLTDAPVNLTHLNMTIDIISAHRVGHGDETWVNLEFAGDDDSVYFDLLALQDVAMNLSTTVVPSGNYTMIKMHVATCNATFAGDVETKNVTDIIVPSGDVRVIIQFGVKKQQTMTILIDMQVDWVALSHSKRLRPVLKATVISE